MQSRAVVFTGPRQVEIEEITVGDPGEGQVQTETLVTLMSMGTELICYRAESDPGTHWHGWVRHPFYPGYSAVGRVTRLGSGVEGIAEGDRVFYAGGHRGAANVGMGGGHTVRVPDGVSSEEAAWCKLATIVQTGVRQVEHGMGDTAVIIGLGPLGQLMTQYLRLLGLSEILAIDHLQARLDTATSHGATATFCGSAADAGEFVSDHTDGELADAVYDVTGHPAVFAMALPLARRFGTVMLQGDCPHPSKQHLTFDVLTRQLRVLGTHNEALPPKLARWTAEKQAALYLRYVERGQMQTGDLITHRHKPEEAPEVYARLDADRGNSAGVVFDWQ